jgi:hypothetical protein
LDLRERKYQEVTWEEMKNTYDTLIGKHEGKRPHGRPRCGWEFTSKIGFKDTGCKNGNWICVDLLNMIMNLQVP